MKRSLTAAREERTSPPAGDGHAHEWLAERWEPWQWTETGRRANIDNNNCPRGTPDFDPIDFPPSGEGGREEAGTTSTEEGDRVPQGTTSNQIAATGGFAITVQRDEYGRVTGATPVNAPVAVPTTDDALGEQTDVDATTNSVDGPTPATPATPATPTEASGTHPAQPALADHTETTMSWRLTTTAAIVLVLTSTMATHAANSGHERDIPEWEQYWAELGKIYRRVKTSEIRYGTEVGPSRYIGEIDPPFVTPDPDQVEVIAFAAFTHRAWITNYPLIIRWIKTLPDNVNVQFLTTKSLRQANINPRHGPLRAVRQNLYQTALRMGVPYRKAHRTIQTMGIGNFWTLEDERSQNRYARKLRLDPEQFQALRTHPAVQWEGQVADWLELAQANERWRVAKEVTLNPRNYIERHFPELMINGRWIVSMTAREKCPPHLRYGELGDQGGARDAPREQRMAAQRRGARRLARRQGRTDPQPLGERQTPGRHRRHRLRRQGRGDLDSRPRRHRARRRNADPRRGRNTFHVREARPSRILRYLAPHAPVPPLDPRPTGRPPPASATAHSCSQTT